MGYEDSHAPLPEENLLHCPSDNLLQLTYVALRSAVLAADSAVVTQPPRRDNGPALRAEGPARAVDVLDLSRTTPTLLPEVLRAAADQAFAMAADPINLLDNNPHIGREWSAVALELSSVAGSLERRVFSLLFTNALDVQDVVIRDRVSPALRIASFDYAAAATVTEQVPSARITKRELSARATQKYLSLGSLARCNPLRAWAMLVTVMPFVPDIVRRLCQFG